MLDSDLARLYGSDMDRLWGEVAPVPAERISTLAGGETVAGLEVAYTPGHANHHVAFRIRAGQLWTTTATVGWTKVN